MTDKGDVLDLAAIDAKTGELSTPPLRFVDAALRLRFRLNVYELRRRVFGFFFSMQSSRRSRRPPSCYR
jgi:hypothetical protein